MNTIQAVPVSTICKYLSAYSQKKWDVNSWDHVATYSDFTHTFKNERGEYITLHIYDTNKRPEFIQYLIDNINNSRDDYLTLPLNSVKILCIEFGNLPSSNRTYLYNYLCKCPGFKSKYSNPKNFNELLDRCKTYETLSEEDITQVKYFVAALDFYGQSRLASAAQIIDAVLHKYRMACAVFATTATRMKNVRILYA